MKNQQKKLTLFLLTLPLLLSACRTITYTVAKDGTATFQVKSLANKTSWGVASFNPTNGTVSISNFNNDQVAGVQAISDGIAKNLATVAAGAK